MNEPLSKKELDSVALEVKGILNEYFSSTESVIHMDWDIHHASQWLIAVEQENEAGEVETLQFAVIVSTNIDAFAEATTGASGDNE